MTDASPALLEVTRLSKRFGGTLALDAVDFEVRAGEVHALLGENGAGKSTLIKILAGVHKPDAGEIRLRDRIVNPGAEPLPISFIHQDLGLVDTMTVAENVAVIAGYPRRRGVISWRDVRAAAAAALERMGGGVDPDARVGDLPAAEKSIVAIARAIAVKCDLLVLDEPTAALPEADVAQPPRRASPSALRRSRHRLCQPSARRGLPHRRPRHRAPRRPPGGDRAVADTTPATLVQNIVGRPLSNLFIRPSQKSRRHGPPD